MRKYLSFCALFVLAMLPLGASAQLNSTYQFSTGTDPDAWIDIETGTQLIASAAGDYGLSAVTNIGFTFNFAGTDYTQFSISADGILKLGSPVVGTTYYANPLGSNLDHDLPKICALGCDGYIPDGGYARYAVVGDEGERTLVVELKTRTYSDRSSSQQALMIQVQLSEDRTVRLVYGSAGVNPSVSRQIGMAASVTDVVRVDDASHTATFAESAISATSAANTWPGENRYYTFTYDATLCGAARNLVATDITTTSVTLSWEGEASEYLVNVPEVGISTVVSGNTYEVSGLNPSTLYAAQVFAICGPDDTTSHAASVQFRTACDLTDLPWSEGFESYATNDTVVGCWNLFQPYVSGSSRYPYVSSTNHTGARGLYSYYACRFATPQFNVAPNQMHVVFWAYTSTAGLQVGVQTDLNDESTWRLVKEVPYNSSTWTEYEFFTDTVNLEGDSAYVVFRYQPSSSSTVYIDDIDVEVSNSCRRPETAQCSLPSYEGALVSWIDNGTGATSHTIRVATSNNVNSESAQDFIADENPYTITGLNSNTTYYAWVATNCDDMQTMWRYAGSFTTQQDCYPVQNVTILDRSMTSAVIGWNYQNGNGREVSGARVVIIDQSVTPADTVVDTEVTGASYIASGLESAHSYGVYVTALCGEYDAYSTPSTTFDIPACGRMQGTTTTSYAPMYNSSYSARNSYTQSLYPASLLEGISEVSGLQWRISSTPNGGYNRSIKVWLGTTEETTISSTNYFDIEDMELVFDGTVNLSSTGWLTINFEENWSYSGDNVVVAVLCNSYESSGVTWGATYGSNTSTIYWYNTVQTGIDPASLGTNTSYSTSSYLPDITFIGDCEQPACLAPLVALESSSTGSVSMYWIPGSSENSWTVQYRPYGSNEWLVAEASTSSTSTTIPNLISSTLYEVRVGSLCGTDTLWSPNVNARTQCGTIALPYTESFEGWSTTQFPECWYKVQSYNNYPYIGGTAHTGSRSMYVYYYSSGYGSSNVPPMMFASPEVPTDADNIKVTFWTYTGYASPSNGRLKVGVLTNPNIAESFIECTAVATGVIDGSWTEWEFYTDNVVADGPVHVAFQFNLNSSTSYGYVDDVTIAQAGDCRKPNTPSRDNISYYSATLHWKDVNHGATSYEVRYNTENNLATAASWGTVNDSTVTLTGLQNGQQYWAWVRQSCSESDDDWLAIPTFTTLVSCYPITGATLVGATTTTLTVGWNYNQQTGMAPQGVVMSVFDVADNTYVIEDAYTEGTSYVFSGLEEGKNYRVSLSTVCDPDTSAAVVLIAGTAAPTCGEITGTPASNVSYAPYNRYYNYGYSQSVYFADEVAGLDTITGISFYSVTADPKTYTLDVYLGNTERTQFTTTDFEDVSDMQLVATGVQHNSSTPGWVDITFDTPFIYDGSSNLVVAVLNRTGGYTGSGIYWRHHNANNQCIYWATDGQQINPASPSANSVSPTVISSTMPDIQFVGNCDLGNICLAPVLSVNEVTAHSVSLNWGADTNMGFSVAYRVVGDSNWTVAADNVNVSSYTVSDLDAQTEYQFRVSRLCGDEEKWSTSVQTYTNCEAVSVPVIYTFEQEIGHCWTLTNNNITRTTDNSIDVLRWDYSQYSIGRAVMPETEDSVRNLMAVITARYSYYNGGDHKMLVGVGNESGTNVTWIDTIELTTSMTDYYVYFSNYTGNNNRIVISKMGGNYLYVQSIVVNLDNNCHPMNGFSFNSSTTNTASLAWSHNTASNFEVQYRQTNSNDWSSVELSGTSGTITGLQPSSTYEARIRAICGESDSSVWSPVITFNTACDAVNMPWSEDFDSWTNFAGHCWVGATDTIYAENATVTTSESVPFGISSSSYGDITIDGKAMTMNLYSTRRYWAMTPSIVMNTNSAVFSFDMAFCVWNSYSTPYDDDDRVVVAITTDGGETFSTLYSIGSDASRDDATLGDFSAQFTTVEVPVIGYDGQTVRIVLYGGSEASGGDSRLVFDNLSLTEGEPLAPCDEPAIVSASATQESITVTYNGSAASYDVAIVAGPWVEPTVGIVESSTSHTFAGLSAGTAYSVGVRAVCADGNKSSWVTTSVSTDEIPSPECSGVSNVSVGSTTNVSATIDWTELGEATQWGVELSTGGSVVNSTTVSSHPATLSNLTAGNTYSVRVRSICDVNTYSEWSLPVNFTTTSVGIEGVDEMAVTIYPNPASGNVTIENSETTMLTIIDLNGREVYRSGTPAATHHIDLSGFHKGSYFARLVGAKGASVVKFTVY